MNMAIVGAAAGTTLLLLATGAQAQSSPSRTDPKMSFFVTGVGSEKGGDLGGLAGADARCTALANAVGSTGKTWRAYLSTSKVDARDRIGAGPWYNAKGIKIAENVEDLHSDRNFIEKDTALTETGAMVRGMAEAPAGGPFTSIEHDMLTGSNATGRLQSPLPRLGQKVVSDNMTCSDWTSSSDEGNAMLGHSDRRGLAPGRNSWNAAHAAYGCSVAKLRESGSAGRFYCFSN
jgi:hypothetical protein